MDDWQKSFTVRFRGQARMRLEAIAYAIWVASGRSVKLSHNEAFRVAVMYPERMLGIVPVPHKCRACRGKVYGSPYCWTHGEHHTEPVLVPVISEK